MPAFRVWVRSLGNASRIRVEGAENAAWLLARLGEAFVFKSSEPLRSEWGSACCSFQILYSPHVTRRLVERLLGAIPEVTLMGEPA